MILPELPFSHANFASFQCAPLLRGNDELCQPADLGAPGTTLHLGLVGYRGFSDVNIMCFTFPAPPLSPDPSPTVAPTAEPTGSQTDTLTDDEFVFVSGSAGQLFRFGYFTPDGATSIKVRMKGGTGNADLRVITRAPCDDPDICEPVAQEYSSTGPNNNEEIILTEFDNILSIFVLGVTDFENAKVKAQAYFD